MNIGNMKIEGVQQSATVYHHDVCLTIRILFYGREIGNIIGIGGKTVQYIRDQSGAKVKISDISTPERIVTITGTLNEICIATELIGLKVEEFFYRKNSDLRGHTIPLTLSLIVPVSQCGFIIGKGGCKIKELRKLSGTSIVVSKEMLPNSTERLVSITGTSDTVYKCVYQVCNVLINTPTCKASMPYKPCCKTSWMVNSVVGCDFESQHTYPMTSYADFGLETGGETALAALAGSQLRTDKCQKQNYGGEQKNQNFNSNTETISMFVPNDSIGCIIGKKGTKISEMRQISGALVYIDRGETTHKSFENVDRQIKITGSKDSISVAKYLIETSVGLQKANLDDANSSSGTDNGSSLRLPTPSMVASPPLSSTTPLVKLFAKPGAISAISSLYATGGLTHLMGALNSTSIQTTGVHHIKNNIKRNSCLLAEKTKLDRNKNAPY